jgi:hypothetical protein
MIESREHWQWSQQKEHPEMLDQTQGHQNGVETALHGTWLIGALVARRALLRKQQFSFYGCVEV